MTALTENHARVLAKVLLKIGKETPLVAEYDAPNNTFTDQFFVEKLGTIVENANIFASGADPAVDFDVYCKRQLEACNSLYEYIGKFPSVRDSKEDREEVVRYALEITDFTMDLFATNPAYKRAYELENPEGLTLTRERAHLCLSGAVNTMKNALQTVNPSLYDGLSTTQQALLVHDMRRRARPLVEEQCSVSLKSDWMVRSAQLGLQLANRYGKLGFGSASKDQYAIEFDTAKAATDFIKRFKEAFLPPRQDSGLVCSQEDYNTVVDVLCAAMMREIIPQSEMLKDLAQKYTDPSDPDMVRNAVERCEQRDATNSLVLIENVARAHASRMLNAEVNMLVKGGRLSVQRPAEEERALIEKHHQKTFDRSMAALYRNLTAALAVEDVVTGVGGDSASAVVFHKLPGAIASALSQHIEGNNPIANAVFERSPQGWAHMAYMVTIGDTFDDNAKIKKLLLAQLTRAFGDQKGFGRANMRVVARFEKTLTAHYEDAEKIPFAVDTVKRFMNTKESEHELREILGVSASIYR